MATTVDRRLYRQPQLLVVVVGDLVESVPEKKRDPHKSTNNKIAFYLYFVGSEM